MSFEKLTEWKDHDGRTIIREPADDPSGIICFVKTWGHGEDTRYRASFFAPDQEYGDWKDGEIRNPEEGARYWPTQQAAKDAADAAYLAWLAEQAKRAAATVDLPAARLIARHHLGDRLHWIGRGGPHADLWIVQAWPDKGHMMSAQGATVDAAAADCAAQLRAAGWTPTHARLEWRSVRWRHCLHFLFDGLDLLVAEASHFGDGTWRVLTYRRSATHEATTEQAVATIAAWCATALPSLHLPPFPGDKL